MTAKDARRRADRSQRLGSGRFGAPTPPATMTLPARPRRRSVPSPGRVQRRPGRHPVAGARRRGTGVGRGRPVGGPARASRTRSSGRPSTSSGPRTRRSATSPPTSRCSSPGRSGGRRSTSPRRSPRRSATGPDGALIASAEVARPGLREPADRGRGLRGDRRRDPRRARPVGPVPAATAARRQRRVRVGQPDRAAPHRQRPRRVRRRPPVPRARGRRPAGDARVLLQRLRCAGAQARRVRARDPERRAGAGRRLPRRLRRPTSRRAVPDDVAAAAAAPGADGADVLGRVGLRAGARRASRPRSSGSGSTSTSGRSEASLHSEGWVDRAIERLRAGGHVYEQDGALWFRSTTFGDDKDRVLYPVRRASRPTSPPTSAT